jgi:uncharacterized protein YbjT (DUF2867 family)
MRQSLGFTAVVGGRGFIGGAIADLLRYHGYDVTIVTSDPRCKEREGYRYGDLLRPETLRTAIRGAQLVIQSANFRTYPIEKRGHTFRTFDEFGTQSLVDTAVKEGVRRYLFISGVGASAESPRPYFRAIGRGEQYLCSSGIEAVSLRPAFVYGPRDRGLNRIVAFAKHSPFVPIIRKGTQLHQPVFIQDVAEAARQLLPIGGPQGIFEIGGPDRMTMRDMLRRVLQRASCPRPLVDVPISLARLGARILEHLPGPLLTREAVQFACDSFTADNTALLSAKPINLTSFEEGSRYLSSKPKEREA